jgi:lambda family phage portal protein
MNALDRVVAWVSPERGLRRIAARERLGQVASQSYDGAKTGRRTDGWTTGASGANATIAASLPKLIARSRDLCRNDANLKSAKRVVGEYAVGTGIELQLGDARWQTLWDAWVKQADADGQLSFHGLQLLAMHAIFESGSVLLRRRWRKATDGLVVPFQIQALEPDYLDPTKDGSRGEALGWIRSGIEFDAVGRRLGYWLYLMHPGETGVWFGTNTSRFVPAGEVSHAYVVDRPGQVTGVPWPHPVIVRARDLADYEDAELYRKKIEACNVGAVTQAGGIYGSPLGPRPGGAPAGAGSGGTPRPEQFEPGTFTYFGPGESVTFNDPKGSTAFGPYVRTQAERIGSGVGVPYSKLTGDLSQANYSSLKAGSNQFEQGMDVVRWMTLIPRVCEPVLSWFFEVCEFSGLAPGPRPDYEWQPPPYPEVDPLKESTARRQDIRAGVRSPQEVLRSRGVDPRRQLEQFAEWNTQLDELGVILDTDPRKVSQAGLTQPEPGTGGSGSGGGNDAPADDDGGDDDEE